LRKPVVQASLPGALSDVVVRNRVSVPMYRLVSPTDKEDERRAARNQAYF
jgi:hypothetical protein